jgi:hypothetical protein
MIDPKLEPPILLRDFCRTVSANYNTVWRWWRYGVLNRETNQIVKLETIRHPTGRCTSQAAYDRFIAALNESGDTLFRGRDKQQQARRIKA